MTSTDPTTMNSTYMMGNSSFITSNQSSTDNNVVNNIYFEVPYLMLIIVLGTLGNILVIVVVNVEKTLRKRNGVQFIVNLAIADLYITAWYLPIVLANVLNDYNNVFAATGPWCAMNAYISAVCCEVSILSIMFIALVRFIKLKLPIFYNDYIGKKVILCIVMFTWIECLLVSLPILIGWSGSLPLYQFDESMVSCMWNDRTNRGGMLPFTIFLITYAVLLPIIVTAVSYYNILSELRKRKKERGPVSTAYRMNNSVSSDSQLDCNVYNSVGGSSIQVRTHHCRNNSFNKHLSRKEKREDVRDARLTVTILVVLIFYTLCWIPYAVMSLFDDVKGHPVAKRACGWLALSNSAINSIIYGVFNDDFRQGYYKLFSKIFCCNITDKLQQSFKHSCHKQVESDDDADERVYKQNTVTFG